MAVGALTQRILLVAAEALLLYGLSRVLFVWVLQALAGRGHGGGWAVKLLRLPGNAVHEAAHALGYLAGGYRVKELVLCVVDPDGRGRCAPGKRWSPLAVPWIATALAGIMPLILGTAVLYGLVEALRIPVAIVPPGATEPPLLALWDSLRITLQSLDWEQWRTYLFLWAAFSIGAELAPSDLDMRRSVGPLLVLTVGGAAVTSYLALYQPDWSVTRWAGETLWEGLNLACALLGFGVLAVSTVAAVVVLPALGWRAVRKVAGAG